MELNSSINEHAHYQSLNQSWYLTEDLFLCHCGVEYCPPNHSSGPKTRNEYVIHFIFQGNGFLKINHKTYELAPEQAFLIPPGAETYYYANQETPYAYAWVAFNGRLAPDYLSQTGLSAECPVCDLTIEASGFRHLIEQILETKTLDISSDFLRTGYLYHILSKLIASGQKKKSGQKPLLYPADTYAEYAKQYIDLNYNNITVTDVVNYVGLSRSYLYKIFKQKYHLSLQGYLIKCRIDKACILLETTGQSITAISQAIGYEDSLTFSKEFKKYLGQSPKHYRMNLTNPQEENDDVSETNNLQ